MTIQNVGATGYLVQGDVLDTNKLHLERALRDYDAQLYLKWNPKKCAGMGTWELRARPEKKTVIFQGSHEGINYYSLEYKEIGVENHIKDFQILGYDIVTWVKSHDLWSQIGYIKGNEKQVNYLVDKIEYNERRIKAEKQEKLRNEVRYQMRQEKSAIRDYKDAIMSGTNPSLLAHFWGNQPHRK